MDSPCPSQLAPLSFLRVPVPMLEAITPLILTYNEKANITRTLERLTWAREVIVVDSDSSDGTLDLVAAFSNARIVPFREPYHPADKWAYALERTGIRTEWVLRLDADCI